MKNKKQKRKLKRKKKKRKLELSQSQEESGPETSGGIKKSNCNSFRRLIGQKNNNYKKPGELTQIKRSVSISTI